MTGFNFHRNRLPLSEIAEQVLRYAQFPQPPAVAAQSALIRDCLPGFAAENALTLFDETILPRIWLGNRITTPTHVDEWNNVACVVAGRRRFTLFPPEQVANLYIGPLDFAPTGAAMSMVSLRDPDFTRYPKFRDALGAAQVAVLQPGDGLFHSAALVAPRRIARALQRAGELLVARSARRRLQAPIRLSMRLLHGILSIRCAAARNRGSAWGAFFEQYVFGAQAIRPQQFRPSGAAYWATCRRSNVAALRAHLAKKLTR